MRQAQQLDAGFNNNLSFVVGFLLTSFEEGWVAGGRIGLNSLRVGAGL
jgi:hypothetical protein